MAIKVTDPKGVHWQIQRRWAPRQRGLARRFHDWRRARAERTGRRHSKAWDYVDVPLVGDSLTGFLIGVALVIGAIVTILLFWWVVLPLLLVVLDLIVLILLAVLGSAGRILLGRPWAVEATSVDGTTQTWHVVGARRSRRACRDVAEALASGRTYEP